MKFEDKTYILNPCYQLKNDIHRVALFSKIDIKKHASKNWHTFIHPIQAAMLSFFTHNRRLEENLRLLANFFSRDITYMEKIVSSYINNPEPIYTIWNNQTIYFPKNILTEIEENEDFHFLNLHPNSFICGKLDLGTKRLYSGPLLLTMMLTNRCHTQCKYCYADTSTQVKKALPTTRILQLIKEAAQLQVQQVNLMGGEIFLHKDWHLIMKELVKYNIAPEFISTKIPLTHEILSKLKDTGFKNIIQVTLDAFDNDILVETLKVKRSYQTDILKGIQLLDKSGLNYQISSVITSYNCDRYILTDLFRFLSTLKHLRDWRITPVNNSITIEYHKFKHLKAPRQHIESIYEYLEEFILPVTKFPILLNKELLNKEFYCDKGGSAHFRGATCSALNTHMFILPDGKVTICEQLYWNPRFIIGDVTDSTLKEVWNSPQALHLTELSRNDIQKNSKCKSCLQFEKCFSYCNRCWADIIKAYGSDSWDFPDPRCEHAPQLKYNIGY